MTAEPGPRTSGEPDAEDGEALARVWAKYPEFAPSPEPDAGGRGASGRLRRTSGEPELPEPDDYVPLTDPDVGGQSQMHEPAWYADKVIDYAERCVAAQRAAWIARVADSLADWRERDDKDPLNRTYKDGRRHAYEHAIELLGGTS